MEKYGLVEENKALDGKILILKKMTLKKPSNTHAGAQ